MNEVIGVILSLVVSFGSILGVVLLWIRIEEWWANRKL
jgi:hypothetical protein